jgi:hypothetical protein
MMKTVIAFFISIACFNAFAADSYTSCTNGTIEQVGDGLFTANFFDDSISFDIYEGTVSFGIDDMTWKGDTISILDLTTTYSVEGTEEIVVVDAIITLSKDSKTGIVAYSLDKGPFRSLELTCEQLPYINSED